MFISELREQGEKELVRGFHSRAELTELAERSAMITSELREQREKEQFLRLHFHVVVTALEAHPAKKAEQMQ